MDQWFGICLVTRNERVKMFISASAVYTSVGTWLLDTSRCNAMVERWILKALNLNPTI